MRLRNVPGAHKKLIEHKHVVNNEKEYKGRWNSYFENEHPIHIEIGMGRGQFLTKLAQKYPDINYIGFEKYTSVLVRALTKINKVEDLSNLAVVRMDVEEILEVFSENEISRIYLNFSDPWPKDRHAKRRLTHENFLKRYNKILMESGELFFKTDNEALFDFSLEEISKFGWHIDNVTRDLHNTEYKDNTMTEYEERYTNKGLRIYQLKAVKV